MKSGAGEDPFADDASEDSSSGDRFDDQPVVEEELAPEPSRVELMVQELEAIDGGAPTTIGVRDANWMAFFRTIEDDDAARRKLADGFSVALDESVTPDELDRSEVLRLSLKYTISQVAGDLEDERREAIAEFARRNA